jgi:hypothetical protein
MALNVPPIDALIREREERLAAEAPKCVTDVTERARMLITEIVALRHMQRGGDQRAEYGEGEADWNHDFRPAANDKELRRIMKNTRGERFQRLFTPKDQRVVPRDPNVDLDTLPLTGFIVSPENISGSLVVKVGFITNGELQGLNGDQVGHLIAKNDVIPSVKAMFEDATPIADGQLRVQRINASSAESLKRNPGAVPVGEKAVGAILYTRGKTDDRESMQAQIFADGSYDALRKTFHASSAYDREIDDLARCQRELDAIRGKLDREYRRGASDELKAHLWSQAERIIARSTDMLANAQATEKTEARAFLADAPNQRTKTGKPNVSPAMAKITAALDRIDNRLDEIRHIGGYNAEDRIILHARVRNDEHALLTVRHDARDAALDLEMRRKKPKALAEHLRLSIPDLEKVDLRPLMKPARALIAHIEALTPEKPDAFEEQLLTIHVIGKIQGLLSSLEWIRVEAAKIGYTDFARTSSFIAKVDDAFRGEQIFAGKDVPRLEAIMEPLGEQLADLRSFLETHAANPPNTKALETVLEDLDRRMEAFALENAIDALTSWLPENIHESISLKPAQA